MSRRFRLAPAFLIIALGVALALHMSPSRAGSPVDAATARAVGGVAITVEDMDRSVDFYSTALFFEKVSDVQAAGPEIERLLGVPGARVRVVAMRLGAERIELVEYLGRKGPPGAGRRAEQRPLVPAHRDRRQRHGPGLPLAAPPQRRADLA